MEYKFAERTENMNGTATREIFKLLSRPEIISFAGGLPATDCLPKKEIAEIAAEVLSGNDATRVLQYGTTEGFTDFRETLIDYVEKIGIKDVKLENTLVITGGQDGLDLMCKSFLDEGDTVLVENPTYLAFLQILNSYEGRAVGVKSNRDGLDLNDLEEKIKKHKPKFIYTVPTFGNPTGMTYDAENRKGIAELTAKYGAIVIEDDPYGRLRFSGESVPPLKAFDVAGNIVYITSFSKIISPGLRVGVAVGDPEIIRKMTVCKQGTNLHTDNLAQLTVKTYIERYLEKNVAKSLPLYAEKKTAMINAIEKYMPFFLHTDPDGGLFIFGRLPAGIDAAKLLPEAVERNVAYIQGSVFYADGGGKDTLRLNYSNASLEQIDRGIKTLGELIEEKLKGAKK